MNIIITGYHHPQSVITQHTGPTSPLQCHSSVWPLLTNQGSVSRSPPIRSLAQARAYTWRQYWRHTVKLLSLTSRHWVLSQSDIPSHKNCIEIHLLTRLSEVLSERVSFSQNKHEKFIFSLNAKVKVHVSCGEGKSKLYRPQVRRISRQMAPSLKSNLCRRGVMHNLPAT